MIGSRFVGREETQFPSRTRYEQDINYLDSWGKIYGLPRNLLESDDSYRGRMVRYIQNAES